MGRYDFSAFIDSVADRSFQEIIAAAESAANSAERASSGRGGPKAREQGSLVFVAAMGRLLFWLRHGAIPDGITGEDRGAYRRIAEKLVAKGQFKPEALKRL